MSSENHTTIAKDSSNSTSSPSQVAVKESPGQRIARTYELLRPIFFNLPYQGLLNCWVVSPGWKTNIETSVELQRRLYRIPIAVPENGDPHFEDASPASANILIPMGAEQGGLQGLPVLATTLEIINHFLAKVSTNNFEPKTAREVYADFIHGLHETRRAFRGIRSSHGWPIGYGEIYCELCERFHTKLKHDHLHPMLRFLEDVDICFKGNGTKLYAAFVFFKEADVPQSCWNDSMTMYLLMARNLKSAWKNMHRYGLQNDMAAKPLITDLVIDFFRTESVSPDFVSVTAPDGLRLQQCINILAYTLHRDMRYCDFWIQNLRPKPGSWRGLYDGNTGLDARIAFKTSEDFDAYVKSVPDIKRRFAEVYGEVKTLMQDIPIWNLGE